MLRDQIMQNRFHTLLASRTVRLCLSTALAAGLLTGCAAGGPHANKFAAGAQSAMTKGSFDKAVTLAERAVLADPRNPTYRGLLGNTYLRSGRFESARQAYDEAMELGDDSGKTALSLSLAGIALGRYPEAADTLRSYRDAIPAVDYGLALALAGRTSEGVAVLTETLRAGDSTPKLRQNLALAYALDGRWREARVMASMDVPAASIDTRLTEWASLALPNAGRKRIATLLSVPVRADSGQPKQLALANFPAAGASPQQAANTAVTADAAPEIAKAAVEELADVTQPATPAPSLADASSVPAQTQLAAIDTPPSAVAVQAAPAVATLRPYRVVGHSAVARPAKVAAPSRPVAMAALPENSTHVVQLGSFATPEGAKRAWRHFLARDRGLAGYRSLTTQVTVNGRQFWRVQAAGFTSSGSANSLCHSVKSRGGACLVMEAPRDVTPQGRLVETRMARRR
jgi:Flp pilus assembly protein TadD